MSSVSRTPFFLPVGLPVRLPRRRVGLALGLRESLLERRGFSVMAIGIRPTVDFAFKLLFGSPEHTAITIHFLNAILAPLPRITSIQIMNPFLGKDADDDKLSLLDILAIDQDGRKLNIEMQTTMPAGMFQRLTYYAARMYGDQIAEGDKYASLRPAISICVLTKPMFPDADELHMEFRLRSSSGLVLTDDLQVHLLQLSKLVVKTDNVSQASAVEQWAYFMLNADKFTLEDVERTFSDHEFTEAAGVLEMISKTPEQRMLYDARLKFQLDGAARLDAARTEGEAQGLREGEAKGLREGEAKGRVEGRREGALLGRISVLQELLGVAEPTPDELTRYDEGQLSGLAEKLQSQLRHRGQALP